MDASSAVTINKPLDEVQGRWQEFEAQAPIASVDFRPAPGGRGTEIHAVADGDRPGGVVGAVAEKLSGDDPDQLVSDDLRRFKQLVETGEIARSDGAPEGVRAKNVTDQEPGRPAEDNA